MSLKVWLPLNGNLNNQGLSNITVTNNGATIDNNGKIGKCYNFSNQYLSILAPLNSSTTNFTICAWVYVSSLANSYGPIYNSRTSGSGGGIVLWMVSSGFRMDDGAEWDLSYSYPTNTWIHVCYTRDPSKKKLYLNGTLIGEANSGNLSGINTTAYIAKDLINPNSYYLNGKLNDVRIYDYCLSPKEVKEISKGLVLHYPLDSNDVLEKNLVDGYFVSGSINSGTVSFENGVAIINNTSGSWCRTTCRNEAQSNTNLANAEVGGKTITLSFDIMMISGNVPSIFISDSYRGVIGVDRTKTNVWQRAYCTYTHPGYSSSYYYFTPHFNGAGNYKIKDLKLIIGSLKDLFSGYNENRVVYDCSGYGNNGTITGTLTNDTNTPRYDKNIISTSGVITAPYNIPDGPITLTFWQKPTTYTTENTSVINIRFGNCLYFTYLNYTYFIHNNDYKYKYVNPFLDGNWHFIVGEFDGTNTKIFIDGSEITCQSTSNSFAFANSLTMTLTGESISDFRIYATALSADDVKALYQEAAFIDNKGDVGCYLFYEDGANSKELLPIPTSGVTFNSDGSYLVNGHIYPPTDYISINPSGKTYYYDIEYSNLNSGNHLYIGFEKYDINKASGSNSECLYLVNTTSVTNHTRVTGTINLATANGTTAAFTKLRVLNNWDNAAGTNQAIIHHISLKEISTLTLNQINKQGQIKSDLFIEADSATVSKYGNITANQLIEI